MKTHLLGLCRGDGLVYLKFELEDIASLDHLSVSVSTGKGCSLPSSWHELNDDPESPGSKYIAIVTPLLDADAAVIEIADGTDKKKFSVSPERAKWESRFTYRLRKDIAEEIRDIDARDTFQRASLYYDHILPDGEGFLLRGRVAFPNDEDPDLEFEVLDGNGHPASFEPIVVSDSVRASKIAPSIMMREQVFTIRLPNASDGLILCVRDKEGKVKSSFRSVGAGYFGWLLGKGSYFWKNAGIDPTYHDWFLSNRAESVELAAQRGATFAFMPCFSIVVPLFNTDVALFWDMAESVFRQTYANWELVLVNASPENEGLAAAVRKAASLDGRVRYTTLSENLGITENTNYGIAAATGDFVCFLDHDDALEPDCLFEYASAVNQHDDVDMLYCDEDKVNEDGSRYYNPFFKTDFDIDLLRSHNYVCHFLCVRKAILDDIEPPTAVYDGAQDHNLTLIVSEKARRIHHVSKVLYHWRAIEGSTASDDAGERGVKDYANDAGHRAIAEHLERLGIAAEVEPGPAPYSHHVKYLVQGNPLVSIVIPNKDCANLLEQCVDSILEKTSYGHYEIVIVENNSEESETSVCYERLKARDDRVSVVTWDGEFNFSKIVNFGTKASRGEYLLFLNNDTEVITPEWLENMLGACQRPDIGVVGAKLLYPDYTIQHAGVVLGRKLTAHHAFLGLPASEWGYFGRIVLTHQCTAVTGACMLTKRSVFEELGGFDESLVVAYNDVDYCLKAREAALGVVYEPTAQLVHYESVSRGLDFATPEKRARNKREGALLVARWAQAYVEGDPFFNPNLGSNFFALKENE